VFSRSSQRSTRANLSPFLHESLQTVNLNFGHSYALAYSSKQALSYELGTWVGALSHALIPATVPATLTPGVYLRRTSFSRSGLRPIGRAREYECRWLLCLWGA
jgi:hypothetical protein